MDLQPSKTIRPFPKFSRPEIVGFFSVDEDRNYQDSIRNLKYLNIPKRINFNLNKGDETYQDKPESAENEQLKHLLNFIKKHPDIIISRNEPNFVCFRGLLSRIMNTPYEDREAWILKAIRFKGTIYLCAEETSYKKAEKRRRTEKDIKFLRYGFKFESYILSDHPSKPAPGNSKPVIEAEEFCAMYSTEIAGKRILYGAEMDGVISKIPVRNLEELRKVQMVEVKVKRRELSDRQLSNFYRFKARNYWIQSFLVGIDSIFVGFRNDEGTVEEVKQIPLKELSDEAKRNDYWHGTVAANFLNDFLNKVVRDLNKFDNPDVIFRYEWDPSRSNCITTSQLNDHKFSFLTPDFITFIENLTL